MQNIQRNINYGRIIAGGDVHIGDKIYVVERDFPHCILFLRIEKSEEDYEAMLSVKGPDDTSVQLLQERVRLPISESLFKQVADFQSLRRSVDEAMPQKGFIDVSFRSLENSLPSAIYQSFFSGDIGVVCADFLNLLQSGKIRDLLLVISTEDEQAQNLPWEMVLPHLTVGNSDGLPRDNFGLVRSREKTLQGFNRQGPTAQAAPIKLLFVPALPENLSEQGKLLEIEDEQRKIIDVVRGLEATGDQQPKLVMEILDCANLAEISEALQVRSHDVVHISGHGTYLEDLKEGILFLEDEEGNEQQTTGKALGQVIRIFSSVKLLVLSACETAVGGSEGSTAEQIADEGLPAVLAMRFSLTDVGVRLFTETFYQQLAAGASLTKAMHDARWRLWNYIQQRRAYAPEVAIPAEWFTPVLYQNQVIGSLVTPSGYNTDSLNRFYPPVDFVKSRFTRLIGGGFIGRKRLLIRLRKCFAQHQAVCLYGLGGLGKTTTAEAFAELYRKRYGHGIQIFRSGPNLQEAVVLKRIFERWKSRTQTEEFIAQQLLSELDSSDRSVEEKLQLLLDNCLAGQRTILIFDNFEDVQTQADGTQQQTIFSVGLSSFFRYLLENVPSSCQVLFTSRYRISDLDDLVTHLSVDKMTYAEQYRYINFSDTLRKLPLAERVILDRRIDGHPRALEFLEGLLRKDHQFDLTQFDAAIGRVESLIFQNLLLQRLQSQLSDLEQKVFTTASVFLSRTPVAALGAVLEIASEQLAPVLMTLRDWSLCFWDEQENTFEVHALTRAWMRTQNQPESANFRAISKGAGEFFQSQPTWEAEVLAMTYFEQAESWQDYGETTLRLAEHYRLIGLYSVARSCYETLLDHNIGYSFQAQAINGLGLVNADVGNYETALSYYEQSLNIHQQTGDRQGEATTLHNIGEVYRFRGQNDTALPYFEQSLNIKQQIGDRSGEADTLGSIGLVYQAQGENETALSYYEQSLNIHQQTGDRQGEAIIINSIGKIYHSQGENDTAQSYYEQCLLIDQQIGDRQGEATRLNNIGMVYYSREQNDTALPYFEQSLAIQQQIGDRLGEASTLSNIGMVYYSRGQNDTALPYLEQSLAIHQQIGDRLGEATTLENIGLVYQARGQNDIALPYYEQSLSIHQQNGDRPREAIIINSIGKIYHSQGENDTAQSYYEQCLLIDQQIGDRQGEATRLNNIGMVYYSREQNDTALPYFEQSLAIQQQIGDRSGEATTLNNIGLVYQTRGQNDTALLYYEQSRNIHQQIGDRDGTAVAQLNMGSIYFEPFQEMEKAVALIWSAHNIFEQLGSPNAEVTWNNLTDIREQIGDDRFNEILKTLPNQQ